MATCQICGRTIKLRGDVIAHHGFKRPGWGSQTNSCYGARYEPYESSRERIATVIKLYESGIEANNKAIDTLLAEPPATLTYYPRTYGGGHGKGVDVPRPEGFDPSAPIGARPLNSYETLFSDRISRLRTGIRQMQNEIARLRDRYEKWVPKTEQLDT